MSVTRPQRRIVSRLGMTALVGALMMVGASPSEAQTGITATDPDGGTPGEHFTDLVMVPGDTNTASIVIAQDTGQSVQAGARFESLSEVGVLHEAVEFTVEGLDTTVTMSLDEALDTESPFWLGQLPAGQDAEVTMTVHLPYETGNETKRTEAAFRVIVTAHQAPTGDPEEPEGPSPGTEPDRDERREAHSDGEERPEEREATSPEGQLPTTGADVLLLVLLAGVLIAAGGAALRAARRTRP